MMQKKHKHHGKEEHNHGNQTINKKFWIKTFIILLPYLYFTIINIVEPSGLIRYTWHYGIWFPLTTYIVFWEGRHYFKIYKQILKGDLNMNTLIGFASHILYLYSVVLMFLNLTSDMYSYAQMWEGPAVLLIVTNIGHALEEKVQKSTLETYHKLEKMKNSVVFVWRNNKAIKIHADEVKLGETILIKNGALVPLDGRLLQTAKFNFSNITGEAKEIIVNKGEEVISGAYNLSTNIKMIVTKTTSNSTIAHIIDKIEEVTSVKPKMQKLADKILKFFVPLIFLLAVITFISWLIIGYTIGYNNIPWITHVLSISGSLSPITVAISAGVTVIAIVCPCALGIATPLVYTVSSMLSADNGMILNQPKSLEEANEIKIIAFDKTGTITSDKMIVSKLHGDTTYLPIAKSLEADINHPIAKAIFSYSDDVVSLNKIKSNNISITAKWNNKTVLIKRYLGEEFNVSKTTTNIGLYISGKIGLVFELENEIKKDVVKTIKKLKQRGMQTIMITGDEHSVAKYVGNTIGIDSVFSEVSPSNKANIIAKLQKNGKVAFVGDGFNDSVAIKQADISIAFSSGSDITNSLADVSIINHKFNTLEKLFTLSKLNKKNVRMALFYALAFNILVIPIAILLLVPPWAAAAIMASSDILVATNAFIYKKIGQRKLKK